MRKIIFVVYSALFVIVIVNFIYYKSLYNKQINYITQLLDRQVQIVGLSVDSTNTGFVSDLSQISFNEDLTSFFANKENQGRIIERLKLFFSKYQDFVTGIKIYDNNKNEFTLKKDTENQEWLEQLFQLHVQADIIDRENMVEEDKRFNYYLPVLKGNETIGDLVITVDYQKYFSNIFSVFNLKDYQWQWVVSDSGTIIYDNSQNKIQYSRINRITQNVSADLVENIVHNVTINGESKEIISSFYFTQLLQRELGLVFSAPTDFFQKYIIRNSLLIVLGTLFVIQLIIIILLRYIKSQKKEINQLNDSEKMLFSLIEEMPIGVIIHNKNREIVKANKVAAEQYSYQNENDMIGKIFPETSISDDNDYFSKNLGSAFNPDQFVIIKKEIGEIVLFRNSIPVKFMGVDAEMEMLIDVTMLESARKQANKANVAKSEFLARMSYEIRTPLNGIIGMTDVLKRYELSSEVKDIVGLLHRSTEVLLSIINDILDFSKIESGRMILDEIPFNFGEEVTYCIDLAKAKISEPDLDLICTIEENIPETLIGDPFRMRQVLTNLINNSIKNTEKGEIRLNCSLKSNDNGAIMMAFELQDTGILFDKVSLKKIFGDFVNIESKVTGAIDESGFGTILSKQLVELMGGELIVESPAGLIDDCGTKISFTICFYSNERLVKDLSFEKVKTLSDIRALVITGSQNRDEELLGSIHKLGLKISVTTFLKTTVNQIKANMNYPDNRYNLIVIFDDDDFNGFAVAKAIWDNKLTESFIILMISSNDKTGNYRNSVTLGIDHYLVKPFDSSELLNVLKNSFPYIEDQNAKLDIEKIRNDIKILVVEDNKMNQNVIGAMLKNLGYTYDITDDGYSGYLQAKMKKYDLIFMDLILPEMDGFESTQRILEHDKSVLVVAFTADNMPETKRKAELSGIKEFISKPVRLEELKKLFAKYFVK
jgi:signal transduction histidine kinase/CheY-like chemotaxis protein